MRTGRTDGTTTYSYIYSGSQLAQMKVGSNTLNFTYDAAGIPLTVNYNGTKYYFTTNIQGDVVAILDSNGTEVASYTYDAWGNCLTAPTSGVGLYNPLRYRGYVYDRETELYYLQSRYYDPEVGRFVNADAFIATGQGFIGNNMFAYCGNNPVMYTDPTGAILEALINATREMGEALKELRDILTTGSELCAMGFKNISYESMVDCYYTLKTYGIDTPEEKAHFFAQCAVETAYGKYLTEIGTKEYFDGKDYGYKYRGAGYIQLTWDYNYASFAKAIGDEEIYNQGANYVAKNYAWQAAGWFWSNKRINEKIAAGCTAKDITRIVKGSSRKWERRQAVFEKILGILS